jgi:hypothetical protein
VDGGEWGMRMKSASRTYIGRHRNLAGAGGRGAVSVLSSIGLLLGSVGALVLGVPQVAVAGPCDQPIVNPIVCENSKPGTPQSVWDLPITGSDDGSGAGDPSIQGFATQISVNHGETVHFKISTNANAYHIDIYRIGYYQGNGARYITTVLPSVSLPQSQPACLFDSTTRLTDCGNWAESASWAVPSDAVSGVYIADLIRDSGKQGMSQIIFIVRADDSHSDLLVQTSDETWQAYNRYGGYSLYYPSIGSRAYKVSYNRPFTTRGYADESFFFSAEYPMVRWLEANGYDVSYLTGVDTASRGSLLLNHPVFLSVGHDEYWSGEQRANVEAARAAGVDLAFFSGNESYWKTRWESSIDGTSTPYRTLVTYKETLASKKIDPSPLWTGTWRDPRFSPPADGGRPENALTGQLFTVDCCTSHDQQIYPITVPAADGKMRLWRNTSVANLAPGDVATLSAATLGYEWDEVVDNGLLPGGIVEMSTSTQYVQQHLIDYGNTYAAGYATHHLTLYRASSGALVFGAGTIRWSWGLDNHHDSDVSVVDSRMQQATVNLLADMNVQPGSLQPGLVPATASTDSTPPSAVVTSPAAGGVFTAETPITIAGTAADQGGGVVGGVEVSTDGGATWHLATGRESWSYTWTPTAPGQGAIEARATDDSANTGAPTAGIPVTIVARPCPCSVWSNSATPGQPASSDATANELGVKFRTDVSGYVSGIRFYKGSTNTGTHVGHLWTGGGTLLGTVTFTNETGSGWQQATFASPISVLANTTYVASYYAPNGHYASDPNFFATSGVDRSPLHLLANGVDGSNGVYKQGTSGFPRSTYKSSNYWVDVVFNTNPPAAPTGLAATPVSSARIDLSWNDVATETAFKIQRSPDGSTGWTQVGTTGANVTTFSDTGLTAGTTYSYRVLATNSGGDSSPSNVATTTTSGSGPPPAPTGLTATAVSTSQIDLSWTDGSGETGYQVQRSPDGTTGWTQVGTTGANVTTFSDTGLAAGTTYYYRVLATNSGGDSSPSNVTPATTWLLCPCSVWPDSATPRQPASSDTTSNELGVKFRADESGYIVGLRFYKGSTNTGTHVGHLWTRTGTLLGTATFTNETASGWQQVSFSAPIAVTAGTTYVASYYAPNGHYAADTSYFATSGVDRAPLHALANGVDGYDGVYKQASSGFPTLTYKSTNYWVDVVFSTVPAPTGLTATASIPGRIDLSWTDVAGETGYKVQRSPDGTTNWIQVGSTGANLTTFSDTGLGSGTTYYYRVVATNPGGDSPASNVASTTST